MAPPSTRAARQLVFGAIGLLVVGGLAIWWVGNLRSLDAAARRNEEDRTDANLREMRSALRSLEAEHGISVGEPDRAVQPDAPALDPVARAQKEVSLDHLRALVSAYQKATDDAERDRILDEFTAPHALYAEHTGNLGFLPFLRSLLVEGRTTQQRRCALLALHGVSAPEAVDFFEESMASEHPEVRFYAAEALPWVEGDQQERARRLLTGALAHEDPAVRRISAASLGVVVGEARYAADVLRRVAVERDPDVLRALVRATHRLLEDEGEAGVEARLREVLGQVDDEQADRIRAALR